MKKQPKKLNLSKNTVNTIKTNIKAGLGKVSGAGCNDTTCDAGRTC